MKLKVGCYYFNRVGEIHRIGKYIPADPEGLSLGLRLEYPFVSDQGETFTERGLLWINDEDEMDLIQEVNPHLRLFKLVWGEFSETCL